MDLEICSDKTAVAARAAELISLAAADRHPEGNAFTVALAGGTTPKLLYTMLAAEPFVERLPWQNMRWFFGDERFVPPDHTDSNYRMAKEALFDSAGVDPSTVYRVKTESGEPQDVAAAYERDVREVVGQGKPGVPQFDVVLLGMGADGHTASLFPHTSALAEDDRLVAPNFVPAMDTWRITLTGRILLAAKQVIMLVTGEEKAPALAQVLEGEENVNTYPSQLLRRRKANTVWLVDTPAARELKQAKS